MSSPYIGDLGSKPVETLAQVPEHRELESRGLAPQRDTRPPRPSPQSRPLPQHLCPSLSLPASASQAMDSPPSPASTAGDLLASYLRVFRAGGGQGVVACAQGSRPADTPRGHSLKDTPALCPTPGPDPRPLIPPRWLEAVVPLGRVHAGLRGRPADADAHLPAGSRHRGRWLRGGAGGGPSVQPQGLRP